MYAIFGHCASGYRELWTTAETLDAAKAAGERVLKDHPVADGGGVIWVEIIGTDVPEPRIPSTRWVPGEPGPDEEAWQAWFTWEKTQVMLGLERGDNGVWQSA